MKLKKIHCAPKEQHTFSKAHRETPPPPCSIPRDSFGGQKADQFAKCGKLLQNIVLAPNNHIPEEEGIKELNVISGWFGDHHKPEVLGCVGLGTAQTPPAMVLGVLCGRGIWPGTSPSAPCLCRSRLFLKAQRELALQSTRLSQNPACPTFPAVWRAGQASVKGLLEYCNSGAL